MSPELIGILSVGVALAGLILTGLRRMDRRLTGFDQRLTGLDQRLAQFDQRLTGLDQRLTGQISELAQRIARLEGRLEGMGLLTADQAVDQAP